MSEAFFWGGLVYAVGFGLFVQRRRMMDTPTAKALSAAIGRAELVGTARGDPPRPSLVTGTPCAYWEAELHRRVPNGKGRRTMKRIAQCNARAGHFWVEDESGRVPVLAEGAQWWLDRATKLRSRMGDAISERARLWVQSASGRDWSDGDMQIVERRLEEGGPVYVLGTLSAAPDVLRATPGRRERRERSVAGAIAFGFYDMFTKPAPPDDAMGRGDHACARRRRRGRGGAGSTPAARLAARQRVCRDVARRAARPVPGCQLRREPSRATAGALGLCDDGARHRADPVGCLEVVRVTGRPAWPS